MMDRSFYSSSFYANAVLGIIEGFLEKRAYIACWVDLHFLQDQLNFWQTDLFGHEKHHFCNCFC